MATILRVRYTIALGAIAGRTALLQTFWRPGTSGGSNADALDCATRVRTMLVAIQSLLSTSVTFTPVQEVDALEDSTGALTGSYTSSLATVLTGSSATTLLPVQDAALVRATTSLIVAGRTLKGRTFVPGFTVSSNSSAATPATASVTTINSAFTGMLSGGTTVSFPVIWHRPGGLAPAGTSGPVTAYATQANYWGTQRRRRGA